MTYEIKGDLESSGIFSVDNKYVANHSGNNIPDSDGNLNISTDEITLNGKTNDIVIFNGTEYNTKPIRTSARIVNSDQELTDELEFSTIGSVYDISSNTTWNYNGSWLSSPGISLEKGLIYVNDRTLKLYYVDPDINNTVFIGTQTIGNRYANVPDMSYYESILDTDGYQVLPTGLKFQWGTVTIENGRGNFLFPNEFLSILIGGYSIYINSSTLESNETIYASIDMQNSTNTQASIHVQQILYDTTLKVMDMSDSVEVMVLVWGI